MRHTVRIALRSCLRLTRPSINKGSANIMHSPITILIILESESSETDMVLFCTYSMPISTHCILWFKLHYKSFFVHLIHTLLYRIIAISQFLFAFFTITEVTAYDLTRLLIKCQ